MRSFCKNCVSIKAPTVALILVESCLTDHKKNICLFANDNIEVDVD